MRCCCRCCLASHNARPLRCSAPGDVARFGTHDDDLERTLWMLPIMFVLLTVMRFGLTMAFRPLFIAIKVR